MRAAVIFVILLMLAVAVLIELNGHATNDGLPLVHASIQCVPPASHYQWKQRHIA